MQYKDGNSYLRLNEGGRCVSDNRVPFATWEDLVHTHDCPRCKATWFCFDEYCTAGHKQDCLMCGDVPHGADLLGDVDLTAPLKDL